MNDRIKLNVARVACGLGLAALLMYGGLSMGLSTDLPAAEAVLWSALGLAIGAIGAWAIGVLEHTAAARWTALVVAGALPIAAFIGWMLTEGLVGGLLAGVLWLNLVAGALAIAATAWLMTSGTESRSARRGTVRV